MAQPAERYPAFTCLDLIGSSLLHSTEVAPLILVVPRQYTDGKYHIALFLGFLTITFFSPTEDVTGCNQCEFELVAVRHEVRGAYWYF